WHIIWIHSVSQPPPAKSRTRNQFRGNSATCPPRGGQRSATGSLQNGGIARTIDFAQAYGLTQVLELHRLRTHERTRTSPAIGSRAPRSAAARPRRCPLEASPL